jgi:hypothetical protein
MAKEIVWSARAQKERFEILEYWKNRNKSANYSIKLNNLFINSIELVAEMPDYFIYYHITDTLIEVVTIWDTRRNPGKFKL